MGAGRSKLGSKKRYNPPISSHDTLDSVWTSIDGPIARQISVIIVGCGHRGKTYAHFAQDFPSRMRIAAIVEPVEHRRKQFQTEFDIPDSNAYLDWPELAAKEERIADAVMICTQDKLHRDPAVAFAKAGYHMLLEKPMSVNEEECEEIAAACREADIILSVSHVLRYYPPVVKMKEIIDSGLIGDVVTINHVENILFWHFAHSYVRGNWRNEAQSSFSLIAKCCHDIDGLTFLMGVDNKCTKISSFGGLFHFKESEAPEGAADRCFDCPVEKDCPYSVQKIYLKRDCGVPCWPMSAVTDIEDAPGGYSDALKDALRTGPYGRCVYKCDNDVCDHQTVNIEFESGATATMSMNAFTKDMCRYTRITGTMGEIRWGGGSHSPISVCNFATREETEVQVTQRAPPCRTISHGGADFFLVNTFCKAVASGDKAMIPSGVEDSLYSHKLCFAAERSRVNGAVVTM